MHLNLGRAHHSVRAAAVVANDWMMYHLVRRAEDCPLGMLCWAHRGRIPRAVRGSPSASRRGSTVSSPALAA